MSKKGFGMIICVLFLVALIAWGLYGMMNMQKPETVYQVSVVVSDSYNDRWTPVRKGLELAAGDHNILLNYVYTGKFESIEEELDIIRREVENGADGIVTQLISSDIEKSELAQILSKSKLVLLETDIEEEGNYPVVGVDYYKIGQTLSELVLNDLKEGQGNIRLGIITGDLKLLSDRQQLESLDNALREKNLEPAWIIGREDEGFEEQLRSGADILITLGSMETERVIDYLESEEGKRRECLLYGEGYSEKSVYYLDKGLIRMLVVPDEFNMGYQSMGILSEQLERNLSEGQRTEIEFNVLDQSNMYEEENQKVVFPIVQ